MVKETNKHLRKTNKQILIITEGEKTEPNYFNRIQQLGDLKDGYCLKVKPASKRSPLQMVKEAVGLKKNVYEKIWVVFDHDTHDYLKEAFTLAQKHGIQIAFSAISFEVWILLHFKYSDRAFKNSEEVVIEIKKYIKGYNKNYTNLYDDTKKELKQACINAARLREDREEPDLRPQNPFVDVDILIKDLISDSTRAQVE